MFRLCRLSYYGQLLEHLVLPYCPALLFVHCYCCFCTLWANEWMNEWMNEWIIAWFQLMQHVACPPLTTEDADRLMQEFPRWLEKVSSRLSGGIVFVIDAVDRCQVYTVTVSYRRSLAWPPGLEMLYCICQSLPNSTLPQYCILTVAVCNCCDRHSWWLHWLPVRQHVNFKLALSGCLQLLEILEISLNLYGPPGNFCVKCRWLTALVSSHDETGYSIAYLRNWSLFLSLPRPPCCAYHVFVLYLGKLVDSVHCIAGQSNANMSLIFLEIPPGISWTSPGNLFS